MERRRPYRSLIRSCQGPRRRPSPVVWFALALVIFAGAPLSALATPTRASDPMTESRAAINRALAILRDPRLSLEEERRQLKGIAEAHLDFDTMARATLGPHWDQLSPGQRQDFVRLFTAFIENAYLSKIQDYAGQDVQFVKERIGPGGYAEVFSTVVGGGQPPIPLNFRLRLDDGGGWKIYDFSVEDVSATANYRNQFNRVINTRGFDALMKDLEVKEQELASLLGRKR
jgi:phospholipid transport system substrate-binding protein